MNRLMEIENKIKKYIEDELLQINFEERPRDPFGLSIYLFFLLKNKVASPALDNIVDWMNAWIDLIINKEKISRFIDRELASAIFGYYALKTNKMLRISLDESKLIRLLSSNINNGLYFDNFTYTILILLSLIDKRSYMPSFDKSLKLIKDAIEDRTIINDAKNLVFSSMLLEKLKEESSLNNLVEVCYRKISESDIRFDDRIYYAWVVWHYRKMIEQHFPLVRDFVENTLKNALALLEQEETDKLVKEMYGSEVKVRVSRIALATFFDLIVEFNESQIEISPFSYAYIKQRLFVLNWIDAWKEFERCLNAFKEERLSDCCNNLRMGLLMVWKNVYEDLEKSPIYISPGKTVDIAPLKTCLKAHNLPDDSVSLIERTWAYLSERAHVEKKKILSNYEVRFCIQLTFSVVEFLLRFHEQKTRNG